MTNSGFFEGVNQLDVRSTTFTSNSIDTSGIDPFRQGVELTQKKYFQQGIAKIWSGNPGHTANIMDIGQKDDDLFPNQESFVETAPFNPVLYLGNYYSNQVVVINSPVNTNENGLDGIIEPLTIRRAVSFTSIDTPFEPHSIRGNLESGNFDLFSNSDQVISKVKISQETIGSAPYEDNVDMIGRIPTNLGYWPNATKKVGSFDDSQIKDGVMLPLSADGLIKEKLKDMSPATENYLARGFSSTSANLYENYDLSFIQKKTNYNPRNLNLTGWWSTNYSGVPWAGNNSSSNSLQHILSSGGTAATVGENLNSLATANFTSASSHSLIDSSNALSAYVSSNQYTYIALLRPSSPAAPTGNIYDNPTFIGDNAGNFGVVYSTSGIAVHHFSSPTYYQTEWVNCPAGQWYFVAVTYDGIVLRFYLNSIRVVPISIPSLTLGTTLRVGRGASTNYANFSLAELMISKNALTPDVIESIRERYFNPRYNLSL